jgi:Uma2 family endonuclease
VREGRQRYDAPVVSRKKEAALVTFVNESMRFSIPDWVSDLESFRRWLDADDLPENARIWYLQGEVWVDMSKEQLFTHRLVKTEIAFGLTGVVKAGKLGMFWIDSVLLSNEAANLSGKPDGLFISRASLESKRVVLVEGVEEGHVEVEGSPDVVLEVVSTSSVQKDTVILREAYWDASIPEYWLVDARGQEPSFDILRYAPEGYTPTRKQKGWQKSSVFGKSFRLTRETDPLGNPAFTLSIR